MTNKIIIDDEQTARLLSLAFNFGTISDIHTARGIYTASIQQNGGGINDWAHYRALSCILRIGYILGQRAERARRSHTHTATHPRR